LVIFIFLTIEIGGEIQIFTTMREKKLFPSHIAILSQ
jgi:hypothetical protein